MVSSSRIYENVYSNIGDVQCVLYSMKPNVDVLKVVRGDRVNNKLSLKSLISLNIKKYKYGNLLIDF